MHTFFFSTARDEKPPFAEKQLCFISLCMFWHFLGYYFAQSSTRLLFDKWLLIWLLFGLNSIFPPMVKTLQDLRKKLVTFQNPSIK